MRDTKHIGRKQFVQSVLHLEQKNLHAIHTIMEILCLRNARIDSAMIVNLPAQDLQEHCCTQVWYPM